MPLSPLKKKKERSESFPSCSAICNLFYSVPTDCVQQQESQGGGEGGGGGKEAQEINTISFDVDQESKLPFVQQVLDFIPNSNDPKKKKKKEEVVSSNLIDVPTAHNTNLK